MKILKSKEETEQLISENKIALLYFGGESCNVCKAIKPKIENILKNYPEIKSGEVIIENSIELSSFYSIFTIPVVLLYIDGKEVIREARHISIQEIDERINRYYKLLF